MLAGLWSRTGHRSSIQTFTIHTLGDEQVYWAASLDNDPTRIIISIVIMIRSHDESATKRRRSNANRRIERERAMTSATASKNHVGVPITKIRPAWINIIINKDHERAAYREWHFELDPIKSAGVGQIWEYAAAGWGVIQIASSTEATDVQRSGGVDTRYGAKHRVE